MTSPYDPSPFDAPPIPAARPVDGPAPVARAVGFGPAMTRGQSAIDVLLILAIFLFTQVAIGIANIPALFEHYFPTIGVLGLNIVIGVTLLIAIGLIVYVRRQSAADLFLGRTNPHRAAVAVIVAVPASYLAVLIVVPLYLWIAGENVDAFIEERSKFFEEVPQLAFWQAALFSAFVGLHEEILFRGFILGRLRSLFRSNFAAVLVSSLIFGLLHFYQGPVGVVQTATVGMVFAIVVIRTGSLWPAIIAHAAFDTIGLSVIPFVQKEIQELLAHPASAPAG